MVQRSGVSYHERQVSRGLAEIMERSFSTAVHWSIDRVTHKSWLRRALPVLALLVALNILINARQSWHDFRAVDALADQRLDVQTALIAGRVADQFRDVHAMTTAMGKQLETGTLTDATLARRRVGSPRLLGTLTADPRQPAGTTSLSRMGRSNRACNTPGLTRPGQETLKSWLSRPSPYPFQVFS
jgi:hypothetical protein